LNYTEAATLSVIGKKASGKRIHFNTDNN
jgi:hypothetical protein